jgi:hypothetical protein
VGRRLLDAWTAWIVGDGWFADLPVVLRFDHGAQLEVCGKKVDDLSSSRPGRARILAT